MLSIVYIQKQGQVSKQRDAMAQDQLGHGVTAAKKKVKKKKKRLVHRFSF